MKYILKKRYPRLPKWIKEGDTVEQTTNGSRYKKRDFTTFENYFSKDEVENNPEFWEEVVDKNYKILSYIGIHTGYLYNIDINGKYACEHESWIKANPVELEKREIYKIHSVRRISDGEIFTVGDNISHKCYSSNVVINSFSLERDGSLGANLTCHSYYSLENLKHHKKPLFTTEDGVDIYEGDYYWIDPTVNNRPVAEITRASVSIPADNWKIFSTKEKAQEYIDCHKPQYGKKDIEKAYHSLSSVSCTLLINQLDK